MDLAASFSQLCTHCRLLIPRRTKKTYTRRSVEISCPGYHNATLSASCSLVTAHYTPAYASYTQDERVPTHMNASSSPSPHCLILSLRYYMQHYHEQYTQHFQHISDNTRACLCDRVTKRMHSSGRRLCSTPYPRDACGSWLVLVLSVWRRSHLPYPRDVHAVPLPWCGQRCGRGTPVHVQSRAHLVKPVASRSESSPTRATPWA